jgi:predicted permease
MRILREWIRRLRGSLGPGRRDEDMEEELRLHLELAADDARKRGVSASDAMRAARLRAGGASPAMEALRDQRGLPWLEELKRDVRDAGRGLRRSPGFAVVALITLALGIGANTAIFSIVSGVMLQPLVYPEPGRLMRLSARFPATGSAAVGLSYPEYAEFRDMNRSFAAVGAFTTGRANTGGGSGSWTGEVNITAGDRPLRVRSAAVDEHLMSALAVQPAQGRFFAAGETDAMAARPGLGGPALAILAHELWQNAFGGQSIVGRTVNVDGRPHDVIGVMPPGVDLMDSQPEIWLPIGVHPVIRRIRGSHFLSIVGRLKDGVTPEAAQTELNLFLENWAERAGAKGHVPTKQPTRDDDHVLQLQPLQHAIVGDAGRAIWVLQGAVALVLLIGCANLANLAMARGASRRREFAVRAALGASRGRLLRQAITEGLLLSTIGGVLGIWLAHAGVKALMLAYPASLPRTSTLAIDGPVLVFALIVSMTAGTLFGLVPVLPANMQDLVADVKEGGERGTVGNHRVRAALVVAEVALAVILVTGAGLLIRTVVNLGHVDAGIDRSKLVTFSMTIPRASTSPSGRARVYQQLLETLRAAPGVQAASAMSELPLARHVQGYATRIEGTDGPSGQTSEIVDYYQFVMSDYFTTLGIPIVAGRGFDRGDAASLDRVAVVNETLATKLWKGRNPIGQRLRPNLSASLGTSANPWHTVIGVAKDVKEGGVDRKAGTELYLFLDQPTPPDDGTESAWQPAAPPTMNLALQTNLPLSALGEMLQRAVRQADPSVPIVRLRDMNAVFRESIRRPRFLAQLLGGFAAVALLLAAVGTYGVLSYMVSERRREIGIRMALGADRRSVIAMILRHGLRAAVLGVAIGIGGAVAGNRLMATLLFDVEPTDAATLAAVSATIVLVAVGACWMPAWRASRLDPNAILRTD